MIPYTKKTFKKILIKKKLEQLNNYLILLPSTKNEKKNVFRIKKINFLKLEKNSFFNQNKTIPANSLISKIELKQSNMFEKNIDAIFCVYNNTFLLPSQFHILNNLTNYRKLMETKYIFIKFFFLLKIFSVKKI